MAALICRDIKIAWRTGGGVMALAFFALVAVLLPLGLGAEGRYVTTLVPGLLWIIMLLACLFSLDNLFRGDEEDGSLDIIRISPLLREWPLSLEGTVLAKCLAHWLMTGAILTFAAPIVGLMLGVDIAVLPALFLTMLIGTPALSLTGAVGACLTLELRHAGLLMPLLLLPLQTPVLIFGAGALSIFVSGDAMGQESATLFIRPLLFLASFSLAALVLAPLVAAAALRGRS
ncbi:MAG: heme exporter protein CcmB [Parvularculales bacterium]